MNFPRITALGTAFFAFTPAVSLHAQRNQVVTILNVAAAFQPGGSANATPGCARRSALETDTGTATALPSGTSGDASGQSSGSSAETGTPGATGRLGSTGTLVPGTGFEMTWTPKNPGESALFDVRAFGTQ